MYEKRLKIVFSFFLGFLLIFTVKIGYLGTVKYNTYTHLSASQRLSVFIYDSNRGDILDRNLRPITGREQESMLVYSPYYAGDEAKEALIAQRFSDGENPDHDHFIVNKTIRNCGIAEHIIGTVTQAKFHKIYGQKGISGLEKQFDHKLKGSPARIATIVDSRGIPLPGFQPYDIKGKKNQTKMVLTLDLDLQENLERIMDEKQLIQRGAVVVMDPHNGQVLSMVSRPRVNFSGIDDGSHLNKAIQINKGYNPASLFKLIIGLYALEQKVEPNTQYNCKDMCIFPHGIISFEDGLAKSCNTVFYELVQQFGPKVLLEYAQKLGLGKKTGMGLEYESAGIMPHLDTVKGKQGNRLLAMGQGQMEVTPIQMAKITSIIANGGYDLTPKIIDFIGENPRKVGRYQDKGERLVSKNTANMLGEMMKKTTTIGTARALQGFGAVKTGTADNGTRWMTGFFPEENPQFVVTVFIEEGYGKNTMQVTREIIKTLFN